jgi:methylmalonyl-CoA/ethylmalonyl-CoA epimerase
MSHLNDLKMGLGITGIDHFAYLVKDSASSARAFEAFFPQRILWRVAHLDQRVYLSLLQGVDGIRIELVEPFAEQTLLQQQLARSHHSCVPYHLCLRVSDFHDVRSRLLQEGWRTLTRPFRALDGNAVASHLFHPAAGMVEIIGSV